MSSAVKKEPMTRDAARRLRASLEVSAYDRASSLLIALLILVGVVFGCLLIAWLSARVFVPPTAVPVTLEEVGGGTESGIGTEGMQLDAPDVAEVARESDLKEPELSETVQALFNAIAAQQADLDDPVLDDPLQEQGGGRSKGTGNQAAKGKGGGAGGGEGSGVGHGRGQRWEIHFAEGGDIFTYAAQLDYFGIELGVVGTTSQVVYAKNLSKPVPDQRAGRRDEETRLYMSWRSGSLLDVDRELLRRAGVVSTGKIILQFYPAETEARLAALEKQFRGRDATQIRRTRFGVRNKGKAYEFYVQEQSYF